MSAEDVDLVAQAFAEQHGRDAIGVWAAPGRVNLIGEHTDYNDGFVLPFALAQRVTIAAGPRYGQPVDRDVADQGRDEDVYQWRPRAGNVRLAGVRRRGGLGLAEAGYEVGGADLVLTSDVPLGAGLSSSAALECATVTALADLNDLDIDPMQRAKLARRGENEFVGAPHGADGPGGLHAVYARSRAVLRLSDPRQPAGEDGS